MLRPEVPSSIGLRDFQGMAPGHVVRAAGSRCGFDGSTLSLPELDDRIAIVPDDIRRLVE
jgi:hypothetical protein